MNSVQLDLQACATATALTEIGVSDGLCDCFVKAGVRRILLLRGEDEGRRCGSPERDIDSASAQPGRMGPGVTVRASGTLASTDFVVGRRTAAVSVLVAKSGFVHE